MKNINKIKILFLICFCCLTSFAALAEEVCRACPFDCRGIGASDKDCKNLSSSRGYGQCCVDLDDRGQDQLRRQDDYNSNSRNTYNPRQNDSRQYDSRQYDSRQRDPGAYDDRTGYNPGDCPSGFHVNERKCTDDERRRGCKDMRSPSGLTCVGWR